MAIQQYKNKQYTNIRSYCCQHTQCVPEPMRHILTDCAHFFFWVLFLDHSNRIWDTLCTCTFQSMQFVCNCCIFGYMKKYTSFEWQFECMSKRHLAIHPICPPLKTTILLFEPKYPKTSNHKFGFESCIYPPIIRHSYPNHTRQFLSKINSNYVAANAAANVAVNVGKTRRIRIHQTE